MTTTSPTSANDRPTGPVLVTGAAGEVGHGLILALSRAGRDVVAVDRRALPEALAGACRATVVGDVTETPTLDALVQEHGVTEIHHLAALLSSSAERAPETAHAVNVEATLGLLRIAAEQGRRLGRAVRFLLPSSIAVYGLPDATTKTVAGAVDEGAFLEPITMYGCNKLACEHLGRYYTEHYRMLDDPPGAGAVDFRAVRYPGLISTETVPTGGTSDYVPEMLHAAVRGEAYRCFVGPEARLPFMTMREAIEATLQLVAAPAPSLRQRVYNIASFAPTAAEFAEALRVHEPSFTVHFEPDERRAAIVDSWPADVSVDAARRDWGFEPRYDLATALAEELLPGLARLA